MLVRRRPLVRAALVGGAAYAVGRHHLADAWVRPADLIAIGTNASEADANKAPVT